MKLNLSDKLKYKVKTENGKEGIVKDFLFDEEGWRIRYLDVSFKGLFTGERLLIPISKIADENWIDEYFKLNLHSDDLKKMPKLMDQQTVSRAFETKLAEHFSTEEYWGRRYIPSLAPPSMGVPKHVFEPAQNRRISGKVIKEDDIETNLRSFNEIMDYEVFTKNGKVGHVQDLIINEKNMNIISLVVQANYGLGYARQVLISSESIDQISYVEHSFSLNLNISDVLRSPQFDEHQAINEEEVIKKFDYTGKPIQSS